MKYAQPINDRVDKLIAEELSNKQIAQEINELRKDIFIFYKVNARDMSLNYLQKLLGIYLVFTTNTDIPYLSVKIELHKLRDLMPKVEKHYSDIQELKGA